MSNQFYQVYELPYSVEGGRIQILYAIEDAEGEKYLAWDLKKEADDMCLLMNKAYRVGYCKGEQYARGKV